MRRHLPALIVAATLAGAGALSAVISTHQAGDPPALVATAHADPAPMPDAAPAAAEVAKPDAAPAAEAALADAPSGPVAVPGDLGGQVLLAYQHAKAGAWIALFGTLLGALVAALRRWPKILGWIGPPGDWLTGTAAGDRVLTFSLAALGALGHSLAAGNGWPGWAAIGAAIGIGLTSIGVRWTLKPQPKG